MVTRIPSIPQWIWAVIAVSIGIAIPVLPLDVTIAAIGIGSIAILTLITPLTTLALLLILAPLRTLIATESALQLPLDIGQILFALWLLVFALHRAIKQRTWLLIRWTPLYIPLIAFIAATGITVFSAEALSFWLSEWLKWWIVLFMCAIVFSLGRQHESLWLWMINIVIVAACGNAVVGLYIFFGGSGADHLLINERFFRAFGTFGQPNPFGGFMGMTLPLAAVLLYGHLEALYEQWRRQQVQHRTMIMSMVYLTVCGLLLAALVASWSRGAWLGFVAAMGVVIFALPRKLWQSVLLVSIAGVILGGVWFSGILPQSIVQRVTSSTEELFTISDVRGVDITTANYAIVERLAHWQAALNMARDNFWLGVGFGNYEIAYEQYRLINWDEALGHAHNYYLNILSEAGIVGASAYVALWTTIIWMTWQARSHPDRYRRMAAIGLLGTWTYISVHSLLDNLYVNNLFLHLGVLLGIVAILHQQTWQAIIWRYHVSSDKREHGT